MTKQDILAGLQALSLSNDLQVAEEFLRSPATAVYDPPIGGKPADERTVMCSQIVGTWTSRLANSLKKNKKLYGCSDFVKRLNEIPGATSLTSVAFMSHEGAGIFWFIADTTQLVGFVVIKRDVNV